LKSAREKAKSELGEYASAIYIKEKNPPLERATHKPKSPSYQSQVRKQTPDSFHNSTQRLPPPDAWQKDNIPMQGLTVGKPAASEGLTSILSQRPIVVLYGPFLKLGFAQTAIISRFSLPRSFFPN